MKKVILSFVLFQLFAMTQLSAQIEPGKFLIGTSTILSGLGTQPTILSASTSSRKIKSDNPDLESDDDDKVTNIYLTPKVGYTILENFVAGLSITSLFQNQTISFLDEEIKSTSNLYTGGIFLRYYIPTGAVLPYIEGGFQAGGANSQFDDEDVLKISLFGFNGEAGIAIPVGNRVNFDVGLKYSSLSVKEKEDNPDNTREINSNFGLSIGVIVWLGGDKGNGK